MTAALLLLTVFTMTGCTVSRSSTALLRPIGGHRYELALSRTNFGLGGPCTFPFDPAIYTEHRYLFTRQIAGEIPAERLQLFDAHPSEGSWVLPQRELRGQVVFSPSGDALDIRLLVPQYDGSTLTKHVPFDMNGHYSIERAP